MRKILTNDQQRLVSENLVLAEQLAQRLGRSILGDKHEKSITMDDLKQEALFGLCEAAMRYDASQGGEFSTMAYSWCRKYVLRAIRKFGTPLSVPANYNEGVDLLHLDVAMNVVAGGYADCDDDGSPADRLFYKMYETEKAEEAEIEAKRKRRQQLEQGLSELTKRERRVLSCLYPLDGEGLSNEETAQVMGITPQRVSQLEEQALRKLEISLQNS